LHVKVISNSLPLWFSFLPFYPLQFSHKVLAPILCIKLCPTITKHFSIDSFLDWEGHHWVFCFSQPDHSIRLIHWNRFQLIWFICLSSKLILSSFQSPPCHPSICFRFHSPLFLLNQLTSFKMLNCRFLFFVYMRGLFICILDSNFVEKQIFYLIFF